MCEQFDKDGDVCPLLLRHNVFTTYAVDNIDHNPSSRTAVDSWHGTAISATQHPTGASDGLKREQPEFALRTQKQLCKLPLKLYECQALSTESERYLHATSEGYWAKYDGKSAIFIFL